MYICILYIYIYDTYGGGPLYIDPCQFKVFIGTLCPDAISELVLTWDSAILGANT